jgi:hypothetical protein
VLIVQNEVELRGYPQWFQGINRKKTPAMKTISQILTYLLIPFTLGLFSCVEEMSDVTGKNYLYELNPVSDQIIDGHVKIRERNDGSTQLELVLNNLDSDGTYPAYIHFNNALEGGGVALTLTPVDGHSQSSVTEIRTLDSGRTITFHELRQFDGHLNIQLGDDTGMTVAQADIGMNALTGRFQQFNLYEGDVQGVSGIFTIEERESGFSLITINIDGSIPGKLHPVTLNFGSMFHKSGRAVTLSPIEGTSGIGQTHLEQLDGDLVAPYEAMVDFQGFVRIHLGPGIEMNTILAQGNIAFVEN